MENLDLLSDNVPFLFLKNQNVMFSTAEHRLSLRGLSSSRLTDRKGLKDTRRQGNTRGIQPHSCQLLVTVPPSPCVPVRKRLSFTRYQLTFIPSSSSTSPLPPSVPQGDGRLCCPRHIKPTYTELPLTSTQCMAFCYDCNSVSYRLT